jgi:PEP-CTERM motif-containing protein
MNRIFVRCATIALLLFCTAASHAGVVYSTYADQATWNGTPAIQTTNTPQATMTVNQQQNAGISYTQTFKTGASGFALDMIDIYSGGKGGGDVRLNIYPAPVGGENTDGFVNTSFSTDLLGGGNGLQFTANGSPGLQYIRLDLTGADEITLAPNTKYAVELDILTGQFSWQRSAAAAYPDGNLYRDATEGGFNGTPPANNRGQRTQVGGSPDRDGGMALYAVVPEPASLALVLIGVVALGGTGRRHRR